MKIGDRVRTVTHDRFNDRVGVVSHIDPVTVTVDLDGDGPRIFRVNELVVEGVTSPDNFDLVGQEFMAGPKRYRVLGLTSPTRVVVQAEGTIPAEYDASMIRRDIGLPPVPRPYSVRLGSRGQGVTIEVRATSPEEAKLKVLNDVAVEVLNVQSPS